MSKIELDKGKTKILFNDEDPDISNDSISSSVTLRENALSECTIRANDEEGAMFLSTVKLYDVISVKYAYEEDEGNLENESDWNNIEPIFKGWVIELTPSLTREGEVVSITAMNGLGLKMMRVTHEYGTQVMTDTYDAEDDYSAVDSFDNTTMNNWTTNGENPWLNDSTTNYIQLELLEDYDGDEIGHFKFDSGLFDAYSNWILTELKIELKCQISGEEMGQANIRPVLRYAEDSYWIPDNQTVSTYEWDTYTFDFTDRLIEISDYKAFLNQLAIFVKGGPLYAVTGAYVQVCEAYVIVSGTAWNSGGLFNLRQILTDADNGIVPKYIEKILNTNNNSGYSLNTDYVYNDTLEYTYLNFPYQDAFMCIQDIIRLGCSMHYLDNPSDWGNPSGIHTGLHWIIQYDKDSDEHLLLIAPVGNHNVTGLDENYTIEDKWYTRPIDNPTIVVRQDMVTQSFKTELPLANYILVAGKYIRPPHEEWTESIINWNSWSLNSDGYALVSLSSDREVGIASINTRLLQHIGAGYQLGFYRHPIVGNYPPSSGVDFTSMITDKNSLKIHFRFKHGGYTDEWKLFVMTDSDHYVIHDIDSSTEDKWEEYVIEITNETINGRDDNWTISSNPPSSLPSWTNIKFIGIRFKQTNVDIDVNCWLDDLWIEGNVIRGAYDGTSINQYGCRFLTIKDSMANTDTLNANDTNSSLSQLALYELLRNRVVRTTGQISIPLNPNIKAGQLIHIHACWNGTTYKIDKDFRITEVRHDFAVQGAFTLLTLTDDLYNSIPINTIDPYSQVMRAINPDYQTRTYGSLKISDGDFDANIKPITKDYFPP